MGFSLVLDRTTTLQDGFYNMGVKLTLDKITAIYSGRFIWTLTKHFTIFQHGLALVGLIDHKV